MAHLRLGGEFVKDIKCVFPIWERRNGEEAGEIPAGTMEKLP